eukprot:768769-Hanusia_phi.AAC.2
MPFTSSFSAGICWMLRKAFVISLVVLALRGADGLQLDLSFVGSNSATAQRRTPSSFREVHTFERGQDVLLWRLPLPLPLKLRGGGGKEKDFCSQEYILTMLEDILSGDTKLIETAETNMDRNLNQPKFIQNLLNCAVSHKFSVEIRQLAAVLFKLSQNEQLSVRSIALELIAEIFDVGGDEMGGYMDQLSDVAVASMSHERHKASPGYGYKVCHRGLRWYYNLKPSFRGQQYEIKNHVLHMSHKMFWRAMQEKDSQTITSCLDFYIDMISFSWALFDVDRLEDIASAQIDLAFKASQSPEFTSTARKKAIFMLSEVATLRGDALEERNLVRSVVERAIGNVKAILTSENVSEICEILIAENDPDEGIFSDEGEGEEAQTVLGTRIEGNSTYIWDYKMLLGRLMDSKASKIAIQVAFTYIEAAEGEEREEEADKTRSYMLRIMLIDSFCYGKSSAASLRKANLVWSIGKFCTRNKLFGGANELENYVFHTLCLFASTFPDEIRVNLDDKILALVVSNLHGRTNRKTAGFLLDFVQGLAKASCTSLVGHIPEILGFLFEQLASDRLQLHDRALNCLCCMATSMELNSERVGESIKVVGNLFDTLGNHSREEDDELDSLVVRAECVRSLGKLIRVSSSNTLKEHTFFCMERILMAFMGPEKETILREAALESLAEVVSILKQAFQPFLEMLVPALKACLDPTENLEDFIYGQKDELVDEVGEMVG